MSPKSDVEEAVVVLTTTADEPSARALSRSLVEERLAACVTRVPVRSTYRWQTTDGEAGAASSMRVCDDDEVLLVIKTSLVRAADLERRILELHPYECPEVVVLRPEHVGAKYLAWLLAASTPAIE